MKETKHILIANQLKTGVFSINTTKNTKKHIADQNYSENNYSFKRVLPYKQSKQVKCCQFLAVLCSLITQLYARKTTWHYFFAARKKANIRELSPAIRDDSVTFDIEQVTLYSQQNYNYNLQIHQFRIQLEFIV